ncbi:FUSC family protein [Streptomyces sp. NPDC053750]|uniref:FUSC family protein n=1 Tax=Streptomyces sp. NPDC053750 TaxID=3365714 RepID=UPI0037D748B5
MPEWPSLPDFLKAVRRAVRVTLAAAAGFYPAVYLLDRPSAAVYALFAPIALGVLSPLPGSGRDRAGTVLYVLPAAAALTALGTALAVATASAVAGMLLVGFALTFGAAVGPRIAGAAPGLQLFYILACFPPYAPGTLPERLIGLCAGGVLLSLCELLVLPEPRSASYRDQLADALSLAARASSALARHGVPGPDLGRRLRAAGHGLRFSRQPPGTTPAGAGRTDRAMAQTGAATRRLLDQLAVLSAHTEPPCRDLPAQALLRGIATTCTAAADTLRGARRPTGPGPLLEMTDDFLTQRGRGVTEGSLAGHQVLRGRSTALSAGVSAMTVAAAVAVARGGARRVPGLPRDQFWYAEPSRARLWWVRLSGNLTLRSVVLQNALRTAIGLALARTVAGSLDLAHGFWVLLAVLTLGRTTAVATWSVVRSAIVGTMAGAGVAGLLLTGAGGATDVYAYLLVPLMAAAFTVGPLGGPAWAQGMFTLVVATAFAQLAPVSWRLAEVRVIDVLTGSAVGLLCGLLAWPAGARAEIRRSMAELLRSVAPLLPLTVAAALTPQDRELRYRTTQESVWLTGYRLRVAEAVYAQLRMEPSPGRHTDSSDWLAVINCAVHVLVGAHWLPQEHTPHAVPAEAGRWARDAAARLAADTARAADFPPAGTRARLPALPPGIARAAPPETRPYLVDVEVWLRQVARDLTATEAETSGL